ncbi:amidase [Chthonobacter rhizosphaerae]|uniref:amidase n=1 Tax=Chthonobacter rhizosphaerae TaxID=2735553 RepID=UPI0015EE4568|nr:amidase [Chthonobacter rhizosphaerae]
MSADAHPLWRLTASEASARLQAGLITSEALARSCLARVADRDPALKAWAYLDADHVIRAARELDKQPRRGPLHGLPVAVKDMIDTADMPTCHNSPQFEGHRPSLDAAAVMALRAAGALVFGKTETTEFAAAGRNAPTGNPHDPSRTSGGSSAGSAAAVADSHVPLALGTQTGGSLIRPASFCGAYALKPSWSTVCREGAKIYSVTLDTIGWYARSVADLDLLADLYGLPGTPAPVPTVKGLRFAVCRSPEWDWTEPESREALAEAAGRLAAAGAEVVDLDLPERFDGLTPAHKRILYGEGRTAFLPLALRFGDALHDDFRNRAENREGFTPEELVAAYDLAALCRIEFDALARGFDGVLTPSAPGEAVPDRHPGNPVMNQIWTLLHVPVINLPGFKGPNGLPVGVSLTGPRLTDRRLLAVAVAVAPLLLPQTDVP